MVGEGIEGEGEGEKKVKLHALVCNAGALLNDFTKTKEGFFFLFFSLLLFFFFTFFFISFYYFFDQILSFQMSKQPSPAISSLGPICSQNSPSQPSKRPLTVE